ncbi:hypothetical protein [Adhaeribacter aquaticus]|uniref:hypothetical protein n=1 Tax=Adhaeribacter aquaticus TaxID=299567 RepID=UPI0004223B04|nr:hypothetical protein [Adhaeribacter aquaticus]
MIEILVEVAVIIGIVVLQVSVFLRTRQKIARLAALYPVKSKLRVSKEYTSADGKNTLEVKKGLSKNAEENLRLLEQGKKFLFLSKPSEIHRVININEKEEEVEMKKTVYDGFASTAETYIIPYLRLLNMAHSNDIEFIGLKPGSNSDPENNTIPFSAQVNAQEVEIDVISAESASSEFSEIIDDTNEYLRNNKGAAADFNILKDISERQSEVLEDEIQSTVSTPLYIGLLGTFLGVIFGLSGIIFGGGVTNDAIQTFIAGVVVAMLGSFCGLLLTLWGNNLFKDARFEHDRLKNAYYTFLQARLLPKLHSDMATSLSNLKSVLDAFNKDFFEKVADFKPVIAGITENIQVQRDFLVKMEEVGYTQIANASVQVFDKVSKSTEEFQKFLGYQQALNRSLEMSDQTVSHVKGLLDRLIGFEKGINNLGQYIGQHDNVIAKQLDFFSKHEKEMEDISAKIEQYFDQAAGRLTELMDARMRFLEKDAQNAYENWGAHFDRLNKDNIYDRIIRYLEPFKELNRQQELMHQELNQTQKLMLQRMERDAETQTKLLKQMETLNFHLDKVTQPGLLKKIMNNMFGSK